MSCQDAGVFNAPGGAVVEVKVAVAGGTPLDAATVSDVAADF